MAKYILNAAGIIIVTAFAYILWTHREDLSVLSNLSPKETLLLGAAILLGWYANSVQMRVLWRTDGLNVGAFESFVVVAATVFGNYLPARAGTAVRFHYLKKVHGYGLLQSGGLAAVRTLVVVTVAGLVGGLVCLWLLMLGRAVAGVLILFFAVLSIVAVVLLIVGPPVIKFQGRVGRWYRELTETFRQVQSGRTASVSVGLLTLVHLACLACRFYVSYAILGQTLLPAAAFLLAAVSVLSTFLAVTPGALGVREGLIGYVAVAIGTLFEEGLLAAAVDRAAMLVMASSVGGLSFGYLWLRVRIIDKSPSLG